MIFTKDVSGRRDPLAPVGSRTNGKRLTVSETTRVRRKRGSITQDEIVTAALRLTDREGESALTFARLGHELKASPTAVYRHFANRNEILRALANHLDGISIDGYVPTDDWRRDLEDLGWRAWRTAITHPAAAAISLSLVSNGANELRAVEWVLRAIHCAGVSGRDAVVQYQVYTNLVLGSAGAQCCRRRGVLRRMDPGLRAEGSVAVPARRSGEGRTHLGDLRGSVRQADADVP